MKPQIYFDISQEGDHQGYLVDEDNYSSSIYEGKTRHRFNAALELWDLKAGHLRVESNDGKLVGIEFPKPCTLTMIKGMRKAGLEAREIHPMAAEVMLKLAASVNNIQSACDGSSEWEFGETILRSKNPSVIPAGSEKMLAAWLWSAWVENKDNGTQRHAQMKKLGYKGTGTQRHAQMKKFGYKGTAKALRDMLSDLGLVATNK